MVFKIFQLIYLSWRILTSNDRWRDSIREQKKEVIFSGLSCRAGRNAHNTRSYFFSSLLFSAFSTHSGNFHAPPGVLQEWEAIIPFFHGTHLQAASFPPASFLSISFDRPRSLENPHDPEQEGNSKNLSEWWTECPDKWRTFTWDCGINYFYCYNANFGLHLGHWPFIHTALFLCITCVGFLVVVWLFLGIAHWKGKILRFA